MINTPYLHLNLHGRKFFFRPILPSDKVFLRRGFKELSSKSRYLRFFAHLYELTPHQLKFFTEVDNIDHVAWGIVDVTNFGVNPAGVGRFIRLNEDQETAEVALTIVDAYQGMGLGRALIALLNLVGYKMGIRTFRYHVLPENIGILESLNPVSKRKKSDDKSVLRLDAQLIGSHKMIDENEKNKKFLDMMRTIEEKIIQ
jgi:RimJ/RimL family protein N-acetyltransferase